VIFPFRAQRSPSWSAEPSLAVLSGKAAPRALPRPAHGHGWPRQRSHHPVHAALDRHPPQSCAASLLERLIGRGRQPKSPSSSACAKVTIAGSIPVQSASGDAKLQFRIEGDIDQKAVRSRQRGLRPCDGRWKEHRSVTQLHPSETKHSAAFRPLSAAERTCHGQSSMDWSWLSSSEAVSPRSIPSASRPNNRLLLRGALQSSRSGVGPDTLGTAARASRSTTPSSIAASVRGGSICPERANAG
jgi:hypothetical protein